MLSPMMTVIVLVVLWAIVVVPMVLRRNDERRRERSVAAFGRGMRALGRRAGTVGTTHATETDRGPVEVFVPRPSAAPRATPNRRPVPAAQEALMYPPDRTEMSAARLQMLARRRRSLTILIGGTLLFALVGLIVGGITWLLFAAFAAGLGGYMLFLRNQALHDRERREHRQTRAASRQPEGYDATREAEHFAPVPESIVRIDDDDIELMSMDTIDLTGLYTEDAEPAEEEA